MGVILALGLLLITAPMTAVALRTRRTAPLPQEHPVVEIPVLEIPVLEIPVVEIPLDAVPAPRTAYDTAGPRQATAGAAAGPGSASR
jgi:hypothetical protein